MLFIDLFEYQGYLPNLFVLGCSLFIVWKLFFFNGYSILNFNMALEMQDRVSLALSASAQAYC
jgi:hypothetical protein